VHFNVSVYDGMMHYSLEMPHSQYALQLTKQLHNNQSVLLWFWKFNKDTFFWQLLSWAGPKLQLTLRTLHYAY